MRTRRSGESGLSLVEALVGTAVMSIAIVAALTVYDASRKAFAKSENATEQQESVRIAFDKLATDIRMLGYNVNPDGSPNRPDEQLEGALDHAIVFRADFDDDDPAARDTPELALAGGAFSTVSTGNDEIVAYVLAKPDGTGPDSITFQADVREAKRDGLVEPVTIGNVVLDPTSPPYTLYRISLNNDASKYGSTAFIVRTPVADNVRSLTFTYSGTGGTFKDASPTILETPAAKTMRASLSHVHVSLIGMTRQPDLAYVDPTDPATSSYRKFEIAGDITPRNMRLKGLLDLNADVTPPGKPAAPTLVVGHCGGLLASWPPNPAGDGVTQYRVSWGLGSAPSAARNVPGSPYYIDGLATTPAAYTVWIQAQDAQGNVSVPSDPATATVSNLNTPSVPTGLSASTDQTYKVAVSFSPVTTNSANVPSGDPQAPKIRDLGGYKLYWSRTADSGLNLLADESMLTPAGSGTFADSPLPACVDRYYHLTAVDKCGRETDAAVAVGRAADPKVAPQPPTMVQAHYVSSNPNSDVDVRWVATTADVTGHAIVIESYQVFRSLPVDSGSPPPTDFGTPIATVNDVYFKDESPPHAKANEVIYYAVRAQDACGNVSADPVPGALSCVFGGTVKVSIPQGTHVVGDPIPVTISVDTPTDPSYTLMAIQYQLVPDAPGCSSTDFRTGMGTSWQRTWTPLLGCAGNYTITATVQTVNQDLCPETATIPATIKR